MIWCVHVRFSWFGTLYSFHLLDYEKINKTYNPIAVRAHKVRIKNNTLAHLADVAVYEIV